MTKNKYTKKRYRKLKQMRSIGSLLFYALMILGLVTGSLFFIRPDTSFVEKRKLSAFPAFTFSGFMDGSYFSEVSTWYSDTFPARDALIAANQTVQSTYGIQADTRMVGGNKHADAIPTQVKSTSSAKKKVKVPEQKALQADMQDEIMNGLYVKNGAAYSVYYFVQDAVDTYIDAINGAAKQLKGTTNVYSLLVPNNSITLSQKTQDSIGSSDQVDAIDYYNARYNKLVHTTDSGRTLRKHKDEYLFFRTDHHWTTLGAYYEYRDFCKEKGIKPHSLSYFKKTKKFSPFLGTFYDELKDKKMEKNPDYVKAYIPNGTNALTYWDESGNKIQSNVISDVSQGLPSTGYYTFIAGDKPLTIIKNPKVKNKETCLVVKESYGNAFIPFLVDHYSAVYIIDFRYTDKNIVDYCKKKKITDLIMINNITLSGSESVAATIAEELK